MDTNRNTLLAIALSLVVLLGWQFLYVGPKMEAERKAAEIARTQKAAEGTTAGQTPQPAQGQSGANVPSATAPVPGSDTAQQETDRNAVLARRQRIAVENPDLLGSINLKGARLDDLHLKNYR